LWWLPTADRLFLIALIPDKKVQTHFTRRLRSVRDRWRRKDCAGPGRSNKGAAKIPIALGSSAETSTPAQVRPCPRGCPAKGGRCTAVAAPSDLELERFEQGALESGAVTRRPQSSNPRPRARTIGQETCGHCPPEWPCVEICPVAVEHGHHVEMRRKLVKRRWIRSHQDAADDSQDRYSSAHRSASAAPEQPCPFR